MCDVRDIFKYTEDYKDVINAIGITKVVALARYIMKEGK